MAKIAWIDWREAVLKIAALPQPMTRREIAEAIDSADMRSNKFLDHAKSFKWCDVKAVTTYTRHGSLPAQYTITVDHAILAEEEKKAKAINSKPMQRLESMAQAPSRAKAKSPEVKIVKRTVKECRRCKHFERWQNEAAELYKSIVAARREQAERRKVTMWSVGPLQIREANDILDQVQRFLLERIAKPVTPRNYKPFHTLEATASDRPEPSPDANEKENIQ
jgi:hypothetical protein